MRYIKHLSTVRFAAALTATLLASFTSQAALNKSEVSLKLQESLSKQQLQIKVSLVEESPLPNFYQVITDKGIFYIDNKGTYVFSGSLLSIEEGMANLTKARLSIEHTKDLEVLKNEFLTYRAPDEKHEILVFYDTTCGYCNKLHSEIAEYNALGITVHYAAYPRSGIIDPRTGSISQSTQQLASIWCAPDELKHQTFEMVTRRQPVPTASCAHSIDQQYELGRKLGVEGTPAVFDMNANLVARGYMPANAMLKQIERTKS